MNLPPSVEIPDKPKSTKGRKPGSKAKPRQQIPADQFKISAVPEEERGTVRRSRVKRDAQQKAIDDKVLEVWRDWNNAGRPMNWLEMPVKTWEIASRYEDDALFFLGKGATRHGKRLIIGDIERNNGISYIPFCVTDRGRKRKDSAE